MAKIDNLPQDNRTPRIGGRFLFKLWRGKLIAQAWPKPRGKRASPKQLEQQERFANANTLAKYAAPQQIIASEILGKRGPLYPRDYLVSAMFGGLAIFYHPDGRKIYPMSLAEDMTRDLDIISQFPGGMMARGSNIWQPINPTEDGQVLYWPDKDAVPVPISPGAEIGGHYWTSLGVGAADLSGHAAKGNIFTCNKRCTITAAIGLHLGIVSTTYHYAIFRIEGTTTKELIAVTAPFTRTVANSRRDRHPFTTTAVLENQVKYAILLIRTDSTTTALNKIWADTRVSYGGYPAAVDMQFAYYNINADTLETAATTTGSSNFFTLDLEIKM